MKQFLQIVVLLFLIKGHLYAQETIYLANGNRLAGKLIGAEGEKVKISVMRNDKQSSYSLRRENVLLAFNADGRYLVISSLDPDPLKAEAQIKAFQGAAPHLSHDLLVRANPPLVIQGTISYESDEVVNYKTLSGAAASINKRELAIIFYRNGRHGIFMSPALVVTALNSTRSELTNFLNSPSVATATTQKTTKSGPKTEFTSARSDKTNKPQGAASPTKVASQANQLVPKPSLTDAQYQQYRASALQRVDEFVAYLNIIVDKDIDDDKKDKAIQEATALFMPDATIEVSSTKRPGVRKLKIGTYLNNLKMSVYASATIEWNEIQYVSELTQAADGNYYGMITGQQTFTGYADNGQDVLYSDVTQKSVRVKLESYRKSSDKGAELKWAVLLGNIGVVTK